MLLTPYPQQEHDSGVASRALYTFDTTIFPGITTTLLGSSGFIRLYCSGGTAPGTTAITDTSSNVWTMVSHNTSGAGDRYTELWKCDDMIPVVFGATTGIACTNSTTTNVGWLFREIADTAGYDTSFCTQAAASLTPAAAAQLTPATNGELIISEVHNNTNTTAELSLASGGAGYALTTGTIEANGGAALSTSQAAGTATGPTWEAGGAATAQAWAMSIIAFLPGQAIGLDCISFP